MFKKSTKTHICFCADLIWHTLLILHQRQYLTLDFNPTLYCFFLALQEKFKKSQKQVNVFTKLPVGSTQIQSVIPIQSQREASKGSKKLSCSLCSRGITFKPEVIQIKVTCVFVCCNVCSVYWNLILHTVLHIKYFFDTSRLMRIDLILNFWWHYQ